MRKGTITLTEYMKATKRFEATIKGYEMALAEVFQAYPQDIFPDTTQGERDDVIERYPGFIDRTSASMGRHIAKVIRERASFFARDILEDGQAVEQSVHPTVLNVRRKLVTCPQCSLVFGVESPEPHRS